MHSIQTDKDFPDACVASVAGESPPPFPWI